MKLLTFLIIFISFLIYSFFNLGRFLDVTQEPTKSDLLVCLGGNKFRINKTLELLDNGYLTSKQIILTGYENPKSYNINTNDIIDLRLSFINQKKYSEINFIHKEKLKSTAEEILFVKKYMREHHLKKVIFITEKPHSRRVKLLFNILSTENNLEISVVANDYKIWNSEKYYKNKQTLIYSFLEIIKIIHNLIFYKFFDNSMFLKDLKNHIDSYKSQFTDSLRKSF
jgi:uncharacterized SAM-binding protein YcdF (DUF218 family)